VAIDLGRTSERVLADLENISDGELLGALAEWDEWKATRPSATRGSDSPPRGDLQIHPETIERVNAMWSRGGRSPDRIGPFLERLGLLMARHPGESLCAILAAPFDRETNPPYFGFQTIEEDALLEVLGATTSGPEGKVE
jgi:hypothetical protein